MPMHRCWLDVRPASWRSMALAWAAGCMLLGGVAQAAGLWVPARDNEVVEVLRERSLTAQEKAWRALRAQARAQPGDVTLAVAVASQAIQWSRQDGDPRWLGQAQAALGHWWTQATPPPEVRLLRATVLQSTHDFDAALRDLRALAQLPASALVPAQRAQAWLTLASVLQVTAQYDEAQRACEALAQVPSPWLSQACSLELRSHRGEADTAQRGLTQLAQQAPREWSGLVQLIRAELAERLGQTDQAALLYQALLLRQSDAYTEGAYADLLLDQGRASEVLALLKGRERNDALLLRLAEAGAMVNDPANAQRVAALRARFAAARERGDSVHRREEARFTLRLLRQPAQALQLAQRNWAVQKEPADARILLEAARAAGVAQPAADMRAFMQRWGWSDRRLEVLL
ncbi:hypothetical protein [Aquabacterium sp.]|uniref:tetratricopeptide repeat protein n=1 Tax=Aquabacterium sp. TaxID=1872578 RepID=UPI0025BC771F|nr:hypothetical protein [Aquabacterium sp.]